MPSDQLSGWCCVLVDSAQEPLPWRNPLNSRQEAAMSDQPDHELEVLEEDQTIPPRPEEAIADVDRSRGDDAAPAPDGDETLQR